jgi:hypothetical protein
MTVANSPPVPPRNRIGCTVIWLGALALLWAAPILTRRFGMMLMMAIVLTYVLTWAWAITISQSRRKTVFRGVRTTLTILFILACLEIPAAFKLVHWGRLFERLTGEVDFIKGGYVADRELGFRRPPNEHWSGAPASPMERKYNPDPSLSKSIDFITDSRGYRNPTDMNQADVIMLGDSFVEGWRISDEQTMARELQRRLDRPVANLGVAGYGPMQELVVLKKDGLRLKPSVVVWFFFEGNDIYDDEAFEAFLEDQAADPSAQPKDLAAQESFRRRSFTMNALGLLIRWVVPSRFWPGGNPHTDFGQLSLPGREDQTVYFLDSSPLIPWSDHEVECWKRSQRTLQQGADICRKEGIHLLLCYIPVKYRVYGQFVTFPPGSACLSYDVWPLPELFADFCRSSDIPFLDLTEFLQENLRSGGMPYSAGDVHWAPEGNTLVADRLVQEIQKRGWLSAANADR